MHRIITLSLIISSLCLAHIHLQAAEEFIWQEQQAKRQAGGLLEWTPKAYTFVAGDSKRYIDFENGNDDNDGSSPKSAWKHHPWDANANGAAKNTNGSHTYIFKGGVIYRGTLIADESGSSSDPIRLCSDPKWGTGPAVISGAQRISSKWSKVSNAPKGLPNADKVWVCNVKGMPQITAIWNDHGDKQQRVRLARHPNWTLSNKDDVKAEWAEWDKTWLAPKQKRTYLPNSQLGDTRVTCQSKEILTATDKNAYDGATVWTEYCGLMGSPYPGPVLNFNPQNNTIMVGAPWMGTNFPIENCRFFLENHPRFLDEPGEYWHDKQQGKLYIRLDKDADPNKANIEVSSQISLIDLSTHQHIAISGLHFRHQRVAQWHKRFWDVPEEDGACIKAIGTNGNITINNNTFTDVVRSVWMVGAVDTGKRGTIAITDNKMINMDWDAIIIYSKSDKKNSGGRFLGTVQILRNYIEEIGERPRRAAHGHAIQARYARQLFIAGNIIKRSFGTAIFLHGGKASGSKDDAPLCRFLVYDNHVEDTCMTNNDWGGIETWQGGPAYVYNNVSLRPHGYWHSPNQITNENWNEFNARWNKDYPPNKFTQLNKPRSVAGMWDRGRRNASSAGFAYAYYHDGGSKQYLFNNIGVGRSSDLDSSLLTTGAVHAVGGCFLLSTFNNTFYKFGVGYQRHGTYPATDLFLGNIFEDIGDMFMRLGRPRVNPDPNAKHMPDADPESGKAGADSPTLLQAFNSNVFSGTPKCFGVIEESGHMRSDLNDWKKALDSLHAIDSQSGVHVTNGVLRDPENNDFRLKKSHETEFQRVKTFVPWGLYACVGEWQFRLMDNEPNRIIDDHWYMDPSHHDRGMYRRVVRHNLYGENIAAEHFTKAPTENWRSSAVTLNGQDQSFSVSDKVMRLPVKWTQKKKQMSAPASERRTLDIDKQNLLIEIYATFNSASGGICGKMADAGYMLDLDNGKPRLQLKHNGAVMASATANAKINDNKWHHLVVEVDRQAGNIAFYINGKAVKATNSGTVSKASLSNNADFLLGKDHAAKHAALTVDFLRVAQGTLTDAETSIEELYAWQFAGPFLKDLFGTAIK